MSRELKGLLLLAVLAMACAPITPAPPLRPVVPPLEHPPPFPEFLRHPGEFPSISNGHAGAPIMVFDPGLFVDEEGYHLFYTTVFCRRGEHYLFSWSPDDPGGCLITETIGSIAYAFSADRGLSWEFRWTPVVLPPSSGFDSAKIETAFPFRVGDVLYIAYSADGNPEGVPWPSRYQIGLAELELGGLSIRQRLMDESQRFERRPEPLLPYDLREGRFDNNVQEPSVVVHGDGIDLYYIGLGLEDPMLPVEAPGQAITSVALGRAELDFELQLLDRSETPIEDAVNITEVRHFEGRYHLFASTLVSGEFHRGEAITWASSEDGEHWSEPTVILGPREAAFDNWGLMAPTVAMEEDRVVLFYTAYESVPRRCFPVRRGGRFGKPVEGGRSCLFATLGRAVSTRPAQPATPTPVVPTPSSVRKPSSSSEEPDENSS